jgi:hypothetical protein
VNSSQLAFGVRQNGQPVNNVQLPPWASGPDDMLAKHRWARPSFSCPNPVMETLALTLLVLFIRHPTLYPVVVQPPRPACLWLMLSSPTLIQW